MNSAVDVGGLTIPAFLCVSRDGQREVEGIPGWPWEWLVVRDQRDLRKTRMWTSEESAGFPQMQGVVRFL
jgi:hypothetical protein